MLAGFRSLVHVAGIAEDLNRVLHQVGVEVTHQEDLLRSDLRLEQIGEVHQGLRLSSAGRIPSTCTVALVRILAVATWV